MNLFVKYFHYMNILWTVCCEYLLSNIYINSSDLKYIVIWQFLYWVTLNLTKTFCIQSTVKNLTQHTFCYYLRFCWNSLQHNESKPWLFQNSGKHQRHFSYCSGNSSDCNLLTQILHADPGQYNILPLVPCTAVQIPVGCEGVVTVHSRNGFTAAKDIY